MDKNLTYSAAMKELEKILSEIESQEIEIDELSAKVKRATELIQFCRLKLRKTEDEINTIISQMDEESK